MGSFRVDRATSLARRSPPAKAAAASSATNLVATELALERDRISCEEGMRANVRRSATPRRVPPSASSSSSLAHAESVYRKGKVQACSTVQPSRPTSATSRKASRPDDSARARSGAQPAKSTGAAAAAQPTRSATGFGRSSVLKLAAQAG